MREKLAKEREARELKEKLEVSFTLFFLIRSRSIIAFSPFRRALASPPRTKC